MYSKDMEDAEQRGRQTYADYLASHPLTVAPPNFGKSPLQLAVVQREMSTTFKGVPEEAFDGNASLKIKHEGRGNAEFGSTTEVYVVNGINTNFFNSAKAASEYAAAIHEDVHLIHASTAGNILADLEKSLSEKASQSYAFEQPPEKAVAAAVLSHVENASDLAHANFSGNVHFAAHSRGALITERGLELVAKTLEEKGWTAAEVEKNVFSHVTVETFGGASTGMPHGVRTVNYADPHDLVAQAFGMETPNTNGSVTLAELSVISPQMAALMGLQMDQKSLRIGTNAPNIETHSVGSPNPIDDLLAAHDFSNYIKQRRNFGAELERFEQREHQREAIHPTPQPGHEPQTQLHAFHEGKDQVIGSNFSQTGKLHDFGKFVAQTTEIDGHSSVTMFAKAELLAHTPVSERSGLTDAIKHHKTVTIGGRADGSLSVATHDLPNHPLSRAPSRTVNHDRGIGGRAD